MSTLYDQSLTPNEGDELIEKFIETYKWYKDFFVTREPKNKIMSEEWFSQQKERILAKVNETFWPVVNYIKYGAWPTTFYVMEYKIRKMFLEEMNKCTDDDKSYMIERLFNLLQYRNGTGKISLTIDVEVDMPVKYFEKDVEADLIVDYSVDDECLKKGLGKYEPWKKAAKKYILDCIKKSSMYVMDDNTIHLNGDHPVFVSQSYHW